MNGKTALVFGATGLVGSELTQLLKEDKRYRTVKIFVRQQVPVQDKIEAILVNFTKLEEYLLEFSGDEVYCCIGTTIKKAGTQEAFRATDFQLVVKIAELAKKTGIEHFLVISSLGANAASSNFYLHTKGEMEEALKSLQFQRLSIVRPSILLGQRKEFRPGEILGKMVMKALGFLFIGKMRKYKGIEAKHLVKAMIRIANTGLSSGVFESNQLQELGKDS